MCFYKSKYCMNTVSMAYIEFHDHYCGSKAINSATMLVYWKAEPRVMEYPRGKMTFN